MRLFNIAALATSALVLPQATLAATITIDDFTTNQAAAAPAEGAVPSTSTIAAPEAIGGFRTISLRGDGTGGIFSTTAANVSGGEASLSNTSGVTGSALFQWVPGGVDLTDGGLNDSFVLDVIATDLGTKFDLTVDGTTVSASSGAAGRVVFPFTGFGDLTNANDISLFVSGPANLDTTFNFIGADDLIANPVTPPVAAIPLPASGLLLGGLILGAGVVTRRKTT